MRELLPLFMAKPVDSAEFDHWQGGPAKHDGAYCTECDRPFLLIWDINCKDPRFRVADAPVFGELERLPLYFCWTCSPIEISYELFADDIEILKYEGKYQGKGFPYSEYPKMFPRTALRLSAQEEFPEKVKQFVDRREMEEDRNSLTEEERVALSEWLGRPVRRNFPNLWIHQLGGESFMYQGQNIESCPNEDCELYESDQPMRFLAIIRNDPLSGLPMLESKSQVEGGKASCGPFVSIVYFFCVACHSVRAIQECD